MKIVTRMVIGTVLLLAAHAVVLSQPSLNFKRVINNWPTIELYFSVACQGQPAYQFNKNDNFRILENGVEVPDFTLWCPDPSIRCAISVALVFDASSSMSGPGNAGAKAAGLAFIDLLDGVFDQAAVLWFSGTVTVAQAMTIDRPSLQQAVNALPANGTAAVWDGMLVGIQELIATGTNPCRAVITITDGVDNASTHTPVDVIALAQRNRIRVYTIGLGSGTNATDLETIALMTGGKFYQTPNAAQLQQIYQEISTIIYQGFQECLITYQSKCENGTLRTVDLSLMEFCNGGDTKTRTYRAPLDDTKRPVITRSGDTLTTGTAVSYQWNFNGMPITGATDQSYLIEGPGAYTVTATDTSGCAYTSLPSEVLSAAGIPVAAEYFDVYPNPFDGRLEITGSLASPGQMTIIVYDLLGQERLRMTEHAASGLYRQTLDGSSLPVGMYMLRVVTPNGGYVKRAVKK